MAFTVTATMSGVNANEHIQLRVFVLTGATAAGGATSSGIEAAGGANVTGTLTPNGTNSLPVFAITMDNPGSSAFTPLTNNTLDTSGFDSGDDWLYAMGRYTGTVTAGTPVSFGGTGNISGDYGTWAGYEILASGGSTPLVDASSPAEAGSVGAGIKTITTASFTPPAGSVLACAVACGGTGVSGAIVMTITDTSGLGLTWTQRAGNSPVTDQSTFVVTTTVPGGAAPAVAASRPRVALAPGWHPGARLPGMPGGIPFLSLPSGFVPAVVATNAPAAVATGAGTADAATPAVAVNAGLATGTGAAKTVSFSLYITGLGGTGAGYFADQNAKPRMVIGDAVWALPGNAGRWSSGAWQADFDTYFSTRAGQGFTAAYLKPIGTTQSGNLDDFGKTFDSLFPFQGGSPSTGVSGANPSTGLTAAFWARIDYMFASALAQGITIFFNAIGYDSDFNSGPGPLAGKSTTEFQAYGAAVGARYASQPNLIWNLADDYFGGNDAVITAFMTGVRGAGDTHVVSIENFPETDSRQDLSNGTATTWGAANATYNFCYSYNVTYFGIEKAFLESSPIPPIQGDGYFYQGNSTYAGGTGAFAFDRAIRQDAWHALSSGARGVIQGDEAVWQWTSTAAASVANNWYQKNNLGPIRTFLEGLTNWQNLIPDTSSVLVTAGRGTHATTFTSGGGGGQYEVAFTDSYVTASRCADKSLAVIYMSHGSTITVDTTQLASSFTATWVDPVSLATSSTTAGTTYNSTAKGSNSQGDPDWVLVLQASTTVNAPAGLATGTGSAQQPVAAVGANAAAATGTGAAKAPVAATGASTGDPAGTGTAQAPLAAVAVNAGLATGTGAAQQATVTTSGSTNAPAGVATGTGAAQQPLAAIAANAGTPSGTGTAQQATGAAGAVTGLAAGTGTADAPLSAIAVNAGLASGTGAAQQATVSTSSAGSANAGLAAGAGAAQQPVAAITVTAGVATGIGTAQGVTGQVSRTFTAGLATGTGVAQVPALAITFTARLATGTGTVLNAKGGSPNRNATSKGTVTASRTSAAAVTARRTSAATVTSKATSVPAVSGG